MTAGQAVLSGEARLSAAGLAEARREARLLLAATARFDPRLDPERDLPAAAVAEYNRALDRRALREPYAYINGWREFYGLRLAVDRRVLIPRPETEVLVERALARAPREALGADLCTGSGAVALAILAHRPAARVTGTDLSAAALAVATGNARSLGLACAFRQGDLWSALPEGVRGRLDFCTCNPPYVELQEWSGLAPEVRDWEPRLALVPPEGWRALQSRVAAGALAWLRPGGWLLTEVGAGQDAAVAEIFRQQGLTGVRVWPDLGGVGRVVEGRREP